MALTAELEQVLQAVVSSQTLTSELKDQVSSLKTANCRLSAELDILRLDKQTLLQTVSSFHTAAREELQLSAAYSECLQALGNCKAQLLQSEHSSAGKVQAMQEQLHQQIREMEGFKTAIARHSSAAVQVKAEHRKHLDSLLMDHSKEKQALQSELAGLSSQLHQKVSECEAKTSYIATDQKTTNLLKSKLAAMRTEVAMLQKERDQLRARLAKGG